MEDKHKEKKDIEGSILMKIWKPRDTLGPSYQGITGKDFQTHENEEEWTAESNKIVRKHFETQCKINNGQWSINIEDFIILIQTY